MFQFLKRDFAKREKIVMLYGSIEAVNKMVSWYMLTENYEVVKRQSLKLIELNKILVDLIDSKGGENGNS